MKDDFCGMRVAITGAGGFIGSHLARALVEKNAEVHLLLGRDAKTEKIRDLLNTVRVHRADLRDPIKLKKALRATSPEIIFHLAAFTDSGRAPSNAKAAVEMNVLGTLNLLNAMEGTGCDHFINTGTCEEYGQNKAPFRETQRPDPVSPYSASKSAAILFCNLYYKTYGYPITNLRPFLTYGPNQDQHMFVPSLIISAILGRDFRTTGGKQTREMNYVTDIVDGYLKAAISKKAIGETINIGGGKQHSLHQIAEMINALAGNRINIIFGAIPYRENEIWQLYCNNTKARRLLGWKPKVGLEEGLKRTISWYRKNIKR